MINNGPAVFPFLLYFVVLLNWVICEEESTTRNSLRPAGQLTGRCNIFPNRQKCHAIKHARKKNRKRKKRLLDEQE
jgi:hypothetical protein